MTPTVHDLLREVGSEWLLAGSPARELPAFSGMLFERHLGHGRTDFALRCTSLDRNREATLNALCARWAEPGLSRLVRAWAEGNDARLARIETMWFELDEGRDVPALFFDLGAHAMEVMEHALSMLGRTLTPAGRATLDAIRAFSPSIELSYCGLMLSRPRPPLRVCLTGLPANQVAGFARHLGLAWSVPVDRYTSPDTPIVLHVDLAEDGHPGASLGVELRERSLAGWGEMLGSMVEDRLCSRAEGQEILGHPAIAPIATEALRRALSRLLPHEATHIIKRINHVKLVSDDQGNTRAKAYLYLCYY